MARLIPNGMPYLGKVGNTLATTTQKGYVSVREFDPNRYHPGSSEKQMAVRARFRQLARIAHAVPDVMYSGLKQFANANNMSPRNAFIQYNWDNVRANPALSGSTTTNWPELQWNWPSKYAPVQVIGSAHFDEPLTVSVEYKNLDQRWPADAKVALLVICPGADGALVGDFSAAMDGSVNMTNTVAVPTNWNGETVRVYIFTMTGETPLYAESNIEGADYFGILTATQWAAAIASGGKFKMSQTVYVGQGTIG